MSERLILDLLRHGACDDGAIYRGRTDSALSSLGWSQLNSAFEGCVTDQEPYQALYSSPLQRCRLPAQKLAEQLRLPLQVDDRLQELDFGDWDGLQCQQVWQQQQSKVLAFWSDPLANPPPGGEPLGLLQQRLDQMLQLWLQQWLKERVDGGMPERRMLCLTHGGVIRTLVSQLLGLPLSAGQQLSLDYASLTRVELYPAPADDTRGYYAQLVFFNRLSDLSGYS